jgi:hypothetical protein
MQGGLSTVVWILMRSPGSALNLSLPKSLILVLLSFLTLVNPLPLAILAQTIHSTKLLTRIASTILRNSHVMFKGKNLLDFHKPILERTKGGFSFQQITAGLEEFISIS